MFVKPVPGRVVRDPVKGTFLPESGELVPNNIFGVVAYMMVMSK